MVMLRMLTFRPVGTESTGVKTEQLAQPINKPKPQLDYSPAILRQTAITPEKTPHEHAVQNHTIQWGDIISAMNIDALTRELARNCVLENIDDTVCNLILDSGHKQLCSSRTEANLQKALRAYRKTPLKLVITTDKSMLDTPAVQLNKAREDKQQAAVDAINSDENIQALKEHLGARVIS